MELIVQKYQDNNSLSFQHPEIARHLLSNLKEGTYLLKVTPYRLPKNNEQLGYYFGVVLQLILWKLNFLGNRYSLDDVRQFLEAKFISETKDIINEHTGEVIATHIVTKSVSNLDVNEMSLLIESCRDWALQCIDLEIPEAEKGKSKYDLETWFTKHISQYESINQ